MILATQFGKKIGGNISTSESCDLRFLGIFVLKGNLQLLEVAS